MEAPVNLMETAGEGGPWGMAILAAYMLNKQNEDLADYLENQVFADAEISTAEPDAKDVAGFKKFMERYQASLVVEKSAVESFK